MLAYKDKSKTNKKTEELKNIAQAPLKITAAYILLAALWIYLSDMALALLVRNSELLVRFSIYKGWVFVIVTGIMLFLVIRRNVRFILEAELAIDEERVKTDKAMKEADIKIRSAYIEIFGAVTGGRLIIMTPEEIKKALGKEITDISFVSSFRDMSVVRKFLSETFSTQFINEKERADDLLIAACEAITNAIKHAQGGYVQIYKKDDIIQVLVTDSGPGIDFKNLPKATLLAGYSTKGTLGVGFSVMLELCDRILLSTQPGNTMVILEKSVKEKEVQLDQFLVEAVGIEPTS